MIERKRVYRIPSRSLVEMLTVGQSCVARRGLPDGAVITGIRLMPDSDTVVIVCEHESFEPIDTKETCCTHDFAIVSMTHPAKIQVFSVQ